MKTVEITANLFHGLREKGLVKFDEDYLVLASEEEGDPLQYFVSVIEHDDEVGYYVTEPQSWNTVKLSGIQELALISPNEEQLKFIRENK